MKHLELAKTAMYHACFRSIKFYLEMIYTDIYFITFVQKDCNGCINEDGKCKQNYSDSNITIETSFDGKDIQFIDVQNQMINE